MNERTVLTPMKQVEARKKPDLPTKFCEVCGKEIIKGKTESVKAYRKRRVCSQKCWGAIVAERHERNKLSNGFISKFCEVCGDEIIKGKTEAVKSYENRRVCSQKCWGEFLKGKMLPTKCSVGTPFEPSTEVQDAVANLVSKSSEPKEGTFEWALTQMRAGRTVRRGSVRWTLMADCPICDCGTEAMALAEKYFVRCEDHCKYLGPLRDTEAEAIEAHNDRAKRIRAIMEDE